MIGIVTALEKEYAAVDAMLDSAEDKTIPGTGAGRRYRVGRVPASMGGQHRVVLALTDMGNNAAAILASLMLQHFANLKSIIMVGIAGGIPFPSKPDDHVRLGDIVVSSQGGVIQYDFNKEEYDFNKEQPIIKPRFPPRPPSALLLESVRLLHAQGLRGERIWLKYIERALYLPNTARPSEDTDRLCASNEPQKLLTHPIDPLRVPGQPRVFLAPIASANKLLKNPHLRDALRDQCGVKAVEMEGSGIADATWVHETGYLVVRGICDYCDSYKNDAWQGYAAVVAAAYTRGLLASMPSGEELPELKPVQIIIDRDYVSFDSYAEQRLTEVLAALLKVDVDLIRILNVSQGSVVVELEMPVAAAYRLLEMSRRQDIRLQGLKITSVTLPEDKSSIPQPSSTKKKEDPPKRAPNKRRQTMPNTTLQSDWKKFQYQDNPFWVSVDNAVVKRILDQIDMGWPPDYALAKNLVPVAIQQPMSLSFKDSQIEEQLGVSLTFYDIETYFFGFCAPLILTQASFIWILQGENKAREFINSQAEPSERFKSFKSYLNANLRTCYLLLQEFKDCRAIVEHVRQNPADKEVYYRVGLEAAHDALIEYAAAVAAAQVRKEMGFDH
jgi:nucleoside phosphorylase